LAGVLATVGGLVPGALPFTGFPIYDAVLLGLVLLMLGVLLVLRARSTRERRCLTLTPSLAADRTTTAPPAR
jgi:hypothetical protein